MCLAGFIHGMLFHEFSLGNGESRPQGGEIRTLLMHMRERQCDSAIKMKVRRNEPLRRVSIFVGGYPPVLVAPL